MDVTPSKKMFQAMSAFVDAVCGEDPHPLLVGPNDERTRVKRAASLAFLHQLIGLSMREGVNRAIIDAKMRRAGTPDDALVRDAVARARADAEAGKARVNIPGAVQGG